MGENMKAVLNGCYGGFGLSQEAIKELIVMGWTITEFNEEHRPVDEKADIIYKPKDSHFGYASEGYHINWFKYQTHGEKFRTNKDIVAVVEKLKEKANDRHSNLFIVEIEEDVFWEIDNYDGIEKVRYGSSRW